MAFKAVEVSKRIWRVLDEERGIELKRVSGSSDGTLYFSLVSEVDDKNISGNRTFEKLEGDDAHEMLLHWHLPLIAADAMFRYGHGKDDVAPLRKVLIEAFQEYHSSGHPLDDCVVKVEFGKDYRVRQH